LGHLRRGLEPAKKLAFSSSSESRGDPINATLSLFERVVRGEQRPELFDDPSRGTRHEEGDERSVIELELLRDGKQRVRLRGAGKRKEDLLLHSDVPQQAAPKGAIDRKVDSVSDH